VVTAPGSGAEIIPFLKTWVNLPAAIGFTVLYAKASACEGGLIAANMLFAKSSVVAVLLRHLTARL